MGLGWLKLLPQHAAPRAKWSAVENINLFRWSASGWPSMLRAQFGVYEIGSDAGGDGLQSCFKVDIVAPHKICRQAN